jgi:glutathione S-transferase
MLTLHDFALDDTCYKVRLCLALLGLPHRLVPVSPVPGDRRHVEALRSLTPFAVPPVLEDDGAVVSGAEAILLHLALRAGSDGAWLPQTAPERAAVLSWLQASATELQPASRARAASLFEAPYDLAAERAAARAALCCLDDHLSIQACHGAPWMVRGAHPTIADIALFPAFALTLDYGLSHEAFPALRHWARRLRALPGFIGMPGIPAFG